MSKLTLFSQERETLPLGNHEDAPVAKRKRRSYRLALVLALTVAAMFSITLRWGSEMSEPQATTINATSFYSSVHLHDSDGLCPGSFGQAISHSGYIGLKGDLPDKPKRSFFWFFAAQNGDLKAPLILTFGGGPGSSGMFMPVLGQSHCTLSPAGIAPNPDAWTEHYNLLALDHPIGVGFSYGTRVNNSRDAAIDAYDFLQKFYVLFPHLAKNPLVIASGSYGGIYIPHVATVIHEENQAIASGHGQPGAQHINLESMTVSNPISDPLSHYRWALQQRCYYTDLYNASTCETMYERLPFCLEAIQMAYQDPTLEHRVTAQTKCDATELEIIPGRALENVELKCNGTVPDCIPEFGWADKFFNNPETKDKMGVPEHINYTALNPEIFSEFMEAGDRMQPAFRMYEPLLAAGIRLLHYVGKLDANCAWPGVFSFLKFIRSQYQADFIAAPDLRWKNQNATVRVVGEGAGDMTYILVERAGHFLIKEQPALAKLILERWITNAPFETESL